MPHHLGSCKYNLSDVRGLANTDLEAVTVPKVNAEVDSVHVLLQVESVILMFAEIAGSGKLFFLQEFHHVMLRLKFWFCNRQHELGKKSSNI